jgi:hypothetical protein
MMEVALWHAPLVTHDFHEPPGTPQAIRDRRFWRGLRLAITGPDTDAASAQGHGPVPSADVIGSGSRPSPWHSTKS